MTTLPPTLLTDPHPAYAALRRSAPVHQVTLPDGASVWLLTRYNDVRAALADPRLSLDKRHAGDGWKGFSLPPRLDANLLNMDPPDHTRIRRLVGQVFTARRVEALRDRVTAMAGALLDTVEDTAVVDVLNHYAAPLTIGVISELLGVPRTEQRQLRAWTDALVDPSPDGRDAIARAVIAIDAFLADLVQHKRAHPGDDLLTALIAARDHDERLTEDELTSLAFLLVFAGYENSTNLIANCVFLLVRHPDVLRTVRDDRDALPAAVEEALRLESPAPISIRRFARQDITVGDTVIPARATVLLGLAAANRDPDVFDNPDAFRLRPGAQTHVGFGHGPHHCLGAALARVEAESAIGALVDRYPRLRIAPDLGQPSWRPSLRIRALDRLMVSS